jgi:hypothetical protein
MGFRIIRMALIVAALLPVSNPLFAESVMVRGTEQGQGFTFGHRGNCYVVFPAHVTTARARLQVIAEGGISGVATPRFPFWPGVDLAVGSVRRDAAQRCDATLSELTPVSGAVLPSGRGALVLIDVEGRLRRLPMVLTDVDYLTLEATFADPAQTNAIQGMSGGFLFINDRPVGMALETTDAGGIRFMRVEELHMNLSRWLGTQGAVTFQNTDASETPETDGTTLALTVLAANTPAVGPGQMVENILLDSGAYVFTPNGAAEIDLAIGAPGARATLSRVRMQATPGADGAVPRRVIVMINASETGGRWRSFWSGEMPPTGELDTGALAPTWAKRLRVIIASAWTAGPVRIDWIKAE